MLKFEGGFEAFRLDEKAITKTTKKQLNIALRQATREWLRHWISNNLPPVDTGMARASFKPLGQFLRVAVPIKIKRKPYYSKLEGGVQSPELGIEKQSFSFTDDNDIYEFTWTTETLHYFLAQYYNGPAPPGDAFIEEAAQKFVEYLMENLPKRVPNLLTHLRLK